MREGDIVAERYRVVRRAGAGGMGTVYEARDLHSVASAPVAIKTLRTDLRSGARRAARLVREAAALADIRHPSVVRYVDHGVLPEGPFLVMEWVSGETLRERLDASTVTRSVTPADALQIAEQIAVGLVASHARGVVHRDLKPSNVMLRDGDLGRVVIVDYGVARLSSALSSSLASAPDLTTGDQNLGTPRYMAPEQIRNARAVDGRADVFALGCVAFECLTGRAAFDGDDAVGILARILFEPLPVPSALRPDLPGVLDSLVRALLERDSTRRPSASAALLLIEAARRELDRSPPLPAAIRSPRSFVVQETAGDTSDFGELDEEMPPSFAPASNALAAQLRALPPANGNLIGRDDECSHVVALLRAGSPVVAVWGAPGIGKTRLVLEAAKRATSDAKAPWDALVFGDLSDAEDADDVVRIVSREAGVAPESSPAPELSLARALGRLGRVLLVLDRVEAVATPLATMLRAFARWAPALQLLVTSRRRWRPPGTIAVELGPLSVEHTPGLSSPAALLFLDRAREYLPSLGVPSTPLDPMVFERVERIARALDGIPLALELSAATTQVLGVDGLLARLTTDADTAGSRSDPAPKPMQGPMQSALQQSWALLSSTEQLALAECSVFRGGFSAQAAEAVLSVSLSERGSAGAVSALELLQSLREHSLLHSLEPALVPSVEPGAPTEARLSMYGAVRDFAAERLEATGTANEVLSRHAAHFAGYDEELLGRSSRRSGPAADRAHRTRVDRDADNLLAAAEWSLAEGGARLAVGLHALAALEPAIFGRGIGGSFGNLLERALDGYAALPEAEQDRALDAKVRQIRARLDAPSGRTVRALSDLSLCLENARARGDAHREATVLLDQGVVHHLDGALVAARGCYESALAILRTATDLVSEGRCVGNLGALLHDENDFEAAARLYREAIALLAEADEVRHQGNLASNLGVLEQELGRSAEARALFDRALSLLEPIRDARLVAIALGNSGVLELELEQPGRALALLERSRLLLSGSEDARSRALCYGRLGVALALLGRFSDAEARLVRAERIAASGDAGARAAIVLHRTILDLTRARAALSLGENGAAERLERVSALAHRITRESAAEGHRADDVRAALRILERRLRE